jgi:hypothetical protein
MVYCGNVGKCIRQENERGQFCSESVTYRCWDENSVENVDDIHAGLLNDVLVSGVRPNISGHCVVHVVDEGKPQENSADGRCE